MVYGLKETIIEKKGKRGIERERKSEKEKKENNGEHGKKCEN